MWMKLTKPGRSRNNTADMKSPSDQLVAADTAVTPKSTFYAHWQRFGYRWLAGLSVLCALALALLTPHDQGRLQMPDPWAYELAAANFAQGKWVLNDNEAAAGRTQIRLQGSRLTQYVPVGENAWAFRQSPGHPLQLVLFQALGWPRLATATLAILAALALYPLLARWYSERLACRKLLVAPCHHQLPAWGHGRGVWLMG